MNVNVKERISSISIRERALHWLAGFLIVMFLLTVLSRAANAMTIPRVSAQGTEKRNIEHTVRQAGKIEADGEIAIAAADGLKIKTVHAQIGMNVEEGTPLMEIDLDHLAEKIQEQETEIEKTELSISDSRFNQNLQDNERTVKITRAQEDYSSTAAEHNGKVETAKNQMDAALTAWENARNNPVSGEEQDGQDETALKAAYEEKLAAYNEALTARDQALTAAQRDIEDAKTSNTKDSTADSAALEKETAEAKLAKYKELQEQDGVITATGKGTVTYVDTAAVAGGLTSETSPIRISDTSEGLRFTATLSEDQHKYVSVGDTVTILTKDNEEIKDVTVESMAPNSEEPKSRDIVVNLGSADQVQVNETAALKVTVSSQAYSTCIPKEALHKGAAGDSDYVLVLTEKKSVLGTQLIAEKIEVTVQEQNEKYAALSDQEVTSEQQVIVDCDKEIEAGDRVRLAESDE